MPSKSKLTLSVDTETVDKAKKLGINISEITETVLKTFTVPKDESTYEIQAGYGALFGAMKPLLKEYKTSMIVGASREFTDDIGEELSLGGYGFFFEGDETVWSDEEMEARWPLTEFLPPEVLLKNLIDALSSAKEMRQGRIRSLELARGIVEAITKDMGKKSKAPVPRTTKKTSGGRIR